VNGVGSAVLVGTLVLATVVGLVLRARDGRVRTGSATGGWSLAGVTPADGEQVLLLQLSSPICAPCRQAAGVLSALTARTPGLVHREIDVAERPGVARELGVLRTPTVVAFDRSGAELVRVSGVPRAADLEAVLGTVRPITPTRPDPRLPSPACSGR
jgi:thiol-disulfide isomerase/thioredoxin